MIITADHGNDPIAEGTDHTREYIPVLMFSPKIDAYHELSGDTTFSSIGATIADISMLNCQNTEKLFKRNGVE